MSLAADLDFSVFLKPAFDGSGNYFHFIVVGFQWTVLLSVAAWVLAFVVGSVVGVARTLPGRVLPALGAAYVELFRNVPLLVQLFIWYFVLPDVVPGFGPWFKERLNPAIQQFLAATLCLGFFTAARVAEQVRAGIRSLPRGQRPAAFALGLTLPQAYGLVLLPVAYRIIIPTLTSEFLNVIKNSAVASTIGLVELSRQSQQLTDFTAHAYESFIAVTVCYALINVFVMGLSRTAERAARLPGLGGAALMYAFDWSSVPGALPYLWQGMLLTLSITAVAVVFGLAIGTLLAILRLSRNPVLSSLAALYVTGFRSVPLVMVLLWFYLIVPGVIKTVFRNPPINIQLLSAFVAFSLFEASYYAEIIRAGIGSVSHGQSAAGWALGLSPRATMRLIVLPQAFRRMVPLLLTQAIILFQDTSLVYVVGLAEFFGVAYRTGNRDGTLVELLLFAGAVYFVLCFSASAFVRRLQKRMVT